MKIENSENSRWVVDLSNGESFVEGRGDYKHIKDKPSPWRRLLKYIEKKDLEITGLSAVINDFKYHLPTKGSDYKYNSIKPKDIYHRRRLESDVFIHNNEEIDKKIFTKMVAVYDGFRINLIVNEKTNEVFVQVEKI